MIDKDKRWKERTQHWARPDGRALFDSTGFAVDVVPDKQAKRFVQTHHYEGTCPPVSIALGLYGPGARLVGVALLGESAGPTVLSKYTGPLRDHSAELGRFVLSPEVGYNGETWFLARAFKLAMREKGFRSILSFADPEARLNGDQVVKPAHWGTIYQASNAMFVGRSTPRTQLVGPNGRPISPRALSKITGHERGWEYATRQLEAAGAPARRPGESGIEWLARVRATPGFGSRRHKGMLAYLFGLDDVARRTLAGLHTIHPYPRKAA